MDAGIARLARRLPCVTRRWTGVPDGYNFFPFQGQNLDTPLGIPQRTIDYGVTQASPPIAPSHSVFYPATPTGGPWNMMGNTPLVLGSSFTAATPLQLRSVHFYKDVADIGVHVATVWRANDQAKLAQATFAAETASGWQSVAILPTVPLLAGTEYIITISHPAGTQYDFLWPFSDTVVDPITLSEVAYYEVTPDPNVFPTNSIAGYYYMVDITA